MRFWCWLTANSEALESFAALVGVTLSALTIIVLIVTWRAIKAQADAAKALTDVAKKQTDLAEQQRVVSERATLAAEKQAEAAIASSAVSEAQRKATEDAARAERVHSELTRHQILSQLRPVLVFGNKPHATMGGSTITFVENHGEGIALNIRVQIIQRAKEPLRDVHVGVNVLGPNKSAEFLYDYRNTVDGRIQARYDSFDGRHFVTAATVTGQNFMEQKPFEVDEKGGSTPEAPVPDIDSPEDNTTSELGELT
jgi:hypothetical protein